MSRERREHKRYEVAAPIQVSWQAAQDLAEGYVQGQCVDISKVGVRMTVHGPIPPRTTVQIKSDRLGLHCAGSIRYCVRQGTKYVVGVEFTGGYRWRPPQPDAPPAP